MAVQDCDKETGPAMTMAGRSLRMPLAWALLVLGLIASDSARLGRRGFEHLHLTFQTGHSHSHLHAGDHRHDGGPAHGHGAPPGRPDPHPQSDDDFDQRYVPASGSLTALRTDPVEPVGSSDRGETIRAAPHRFPNRRPCFTEAPPRGPPA
jgi:hypothetical protein